MSQHQYNVMKAKFECYLTDYAYLSDRQLEAMKQMAIELQHYKNKIRLLFDMGKTSDN